MATDFDPISVSIVQSKLKAIAEEMGLVLLRTTRSPILNEARDFVTGLYDAQGRMLEQAEYIPVLAFALQPACQQIIKYFGDDIHSGDIILHNDVFSGGNQNSDVAVFKPVFVAGELVAWAACKGHQADIGGNVAGGYNPEAREVWQEAFRIPPVKIYSQGNRCEDVWNLIFANIRFKIVEEDINAQMGACVVGERGITALIEKHGPAEFQALVDQMYASTERLVKSQIGRIEDGVYEGESYAFYDGVTEGSKMRIALRVEVAGESITFDFSGTSAQTPGFVNAPYAATASALMLTFLMLIDPNIPHNDGLVRPINIINPEGSFLNAAYPAATTFGNSLTGPTSDAIFKAMAKALPDVVTAGWNRMLGFTLTGIDSGRDGENFVDILFMALKGGSGATRDTDGYDHIGLINCAGGILAQDYEMFELQNPHHLLRHEYREDSAGAGQWRGGLGVETDFIIGGEKITGVVFGDGVEEEARAFGQFDGKAGEINHLTLSYPDGSTYSPNSKEIVRDIPTGTLYHQIAGGGGGYGDPFKRDECQVLKDVLCGFVSKEAAQTQYGVSIDIGAKSVNRKETDQLRKTS